MSDTAPATAATAELMTPQRVLAIVVEAVGEVWEQNQETLGPDTVLYGEDSDHDSVDITEILQAIEDKFAVLGHKVEIYIEDLVGIRTIRQAVNFILPLVGL